MMTLIFYDFSNQISDYLLNLRHLRSIFNCLRKTFNDKPTHSYSTPSP